MKRNEATEGQKRGLAAAIGGREDGKLGREELRAM